MADEVLVVAYTAGHVYHLAKSNKHSFSAFGGPPPDDIKGLRRGQTPPHYIGRLHVNELAPLIKAPGLSVPLFYPMKYDGGFIQYKFGGSAVELIRFSRASARKDFPYRDYPLLLPFAPLRLAKKQKNDVSTIL